MAKYKQWEAHGWPYGSKLKAKPEKSHETQAVSEEDDGKTGHADVLMHLLNIPND